MSNLAETYQSRTEKEHVLLNPDTYIGSVENVDASMWIYDDATNRLVLRNIELVPGLYKLFDEGIVNCRDHVIRMIHSPLLDKKFVSGIEITVSEDGTITMENDGNGIDVAKHPTFDKWIPEMIFAHLRTSTNYNTEEKRIVGGKNGFGFKLVLIWSVYGRVETVDHVRGLKYIQEYTNNLDTICEPTITKVKTQKPYTKITFKPDYVRFGMPNGLTSDMFGLLKKRAFDIAATTDHSARKVAFKFNGEPIPVKNFQQYIDRYIGTKDVGNGTGLRAYEQSDERWEYAVALSPTHEFVAVSFVNGICTFKGGKHVDYIMGQITRKLCAYIEKKKKIAVNPNSIKEQLILFLRCDIENPAFDSQTKDFLNTPSAKFGSSCSVSDTFIEHIAKMGVMDVACSLTEAKENKVLAKKTDGSKVKTIRGIANFIDANYSGTARSDECTLVVCEGLSALTGVVSGLSSDDRNFIGIYPLKGKPLNVRGEQAKKVAENKEITDLKKILGLETGKEYATMDDVKRSLRYGKILILCDQDLDGSHIKGLFINLFHTEWVSLVKIPGFISFMNTPILRATKGQATLVFYNEGEYQSWKQTTPNASSWTIKYFKGLGTSTSAEWKGYFANKKIVDFIYNGAMSDNAIDKVFNKKRAQDRKTWLEAYDKDAFLDTTKSSVECEAFIDDEMRHFSIYDCARSIPNGVDGLKTSQRKILFAAFKRKLVNEIKVAQLSGYVSEHTEYHHGEASLNGAIVGLAQNYVGSNNINILEPNGQFGTRLHGGDDSASERYIFTQLNPISRKIFPEADDAVLNYLNDDGTPVEPDFYVPIIPFALINGISGIGTGFSSTIPSYHPKDLIAHLRAKLKNDTPTTFDAKPYYEGFKGTIQQLDEHRFLLKGLYEKLGGDKIRITELPVGTWTMPYTTFLESLADGTVGKDGKKIPSSIKDFVSLSTEVAVDFTVVFAAGKVAELEASVDENGINGIERVLRLTSSVSSSNMHLFNSDIRLTKYETTNDIIEAFYGVRIGLYQKRKDCLVKDLQAKLLKMTNKAKYIQETLSGKVDLRKKTATQVKELLTQRNYDELDGDYKYLTKMPMDSVTEENVASIIKDRDDLQKDLEILMRTSLATMWLNELDILEKEYDVYKTKREQVQSGSVVKKTKTKK